MKTLYFVMYLLYRYYSKGGTKDIPYFSALCAVVFLIYIHIFQILILLNKAILISIKENDQRMTKYIFLGLLLLPIGYTIYTLAKPSVVMKLQYSAEKIKRGNTNLIIYIISNIILLFAMMFLFRKTISASL